MERTDNRAIWNIAKTLHKKSARLDTGLFLIEGSREIDLASKHGVEIVHIFDSSNTSAKNMERISYCGEITAAAKIPQKSLQDFVPPENPLIIVLDNLEKPGNIGAVIRTAEAAGVSALFVCGGAGDLTNPNLIRASLGAVFCLPVFCTEPQAAAQWLEQRGIPIVTASPDAKIKYYDYNYSGASAIIIGSEADGISELWASRASESVTIPMTGEVNSLNASVSAAILIYEAVKQRGSN